MAFCLDMNSIVELIETLFKDLDSADGRVLDFCCVGQVRFPMVTNNYFIIFYILSFII
jgi:hypothetical protein